MRAFYVVLDSFGIGASKDSASFGDSGSDTLGHIASKVPNFSLPMLESMGLGILKTHPSIKGLQTLNTYVARLEEVSASKDTTAGHWEMMGIKLEKPFPRYSEGFPKEIMDEFTERTGYGWIGNIPASGTVILDQMGEEHLNTGKLICYTSADSVFQIAAHVDVVSLEELYRVCKITRELMDKYNVGRVIARPFAGTPGKFFRLNEKRHDYSVKPIKRVYIEDLQEKGIETVSVGKIYDIFVGAGLNKQIHTDNNIDGMNKLLELAKTEPGNSFIFVNLVEFDSVYGHRRNTEGYYSALRDFDSFLERFLPQMKKDDYLFITADHGCDPEFPGSDHTREDVPMIVYSPSFKSFKNLGTLKGFMRGGATVLNLFGISSDSEPLF